MSDRSERIREYLEKSSTTMAEKLKATQDHIEERSGVINAGQHDIFTDNESFLAHLMFYGGKTSDAIRRTYREVSGHAPWTDAAEPVTLLEEQLIPKLVPLPLQAMADGIQISSETPSFAVKKYKRMGALGQIYESESFVRDSELIAMEYLDDEECVRLMKAGILSSVKNIGLLCGYPNYSGPDLNHIWDIYLMAARSTCTSLFLAGQELGAYTSTDDVLSGILAATEGSD